MIFKIILLIIFHIIAGLADDARKLPLFQIPEFPQLVEDTTTNNIGKIRTFTFKNNAELGLDMPSIILGLATPTHRIFTEILDYNYKFLGVVKMYYDFPAPKSTDFTVDWDGLIYNLNDKNDQGIIAPDGEYFIQIKALKLFGDVNNENDYEVWLSPKFIIKRGA
jgi:minor extracellular serine protease Vpr